MEKPRTLTGAELNHKDTGRGPLGMQRVDETKDDHVDASELKREKR